MEIKTKSRKSLIIKLDYADYQKASKYIWYNKISKDRIRIYTTVDCKTLTLQQLIFDADKNHIVVFANGDKTDYRRDNIEILTRKEYGHRFGGSNRTNKSSQYHGVYFCSTTNKWYVRVNKDEKANSEHSYKTEKEAAIVADYLSVQKYGKMAYLNFKELDPIELGQKYLRIKEKYGHTSTEIKSKSTQGVSRSTNKSSKYIGVHLDKRRNKWIARIKHNGKSIHIGSFSNEMDAAHAYDHAAIKIYGTGAKTNL